MSSNFRWVGVIAILLIWGVLVSGIWASQATEQAPPTQVELPQPDEINAQTLKVSLADAILTRDNCNAYATKLRAEIIKLNAEIQKLKAAQPPVKK